MSSNGDGHFENVFLILVVGGLALAAALYGAFLFWPYLIFFFLPIIVGSVIVGVILRMATAQDEGGQFQYKNLAIAFPIMIALTLLVFFAQSERAIMLDKKGNIIGTYHDWPEVNRMFNEYRSSTYVESPFDSLKAKARVPVVFDRQELGWMMFLCLFLGGPAFFWYLARDDKWAARNVSEELALERTKHIWERVDKKEMELDEIISRNLKSAKDQIAIAKTPEHELQLRIRSYAREGGIYDGYAEGVETAKTGGVLDSDIL